MAKSFEQSHEAYSRGDGALAKELSNQGKDHQKKMEALNKEASDWIYIGTFITLIRSVILKSHSGHAVENNKVTHLSFKHVILSIDASWSCIQDSKPGEIDLHGLYVKEAISRTDLALQQAKQRGDSDVHLIVGL